MYWDVDWSSGCKRFQMSFCQSNRQVLTIDTFGGSTIRLLPSTSISRELSGEYTVTGGDCTSILVCPYRCTGIPVTQTLEGSFSAVSKSIFSIEGLFCWIFQALQHWHAFAPLQVKYLQVFVIFQFDAISGSTLFCKFVHISSDSESIFFCRTFH